MLQLEAAMTSGRHPAEEVLAFLKGSTFLGLLSDTALQTLVRAGRARKFAQDEVISRRGDQGDSVLVILSGALKIKNTTPDGRDVGLNFLGVGDVAGEIAVLDGRERTADIVALGETEVFVIQRRDVLPTLLSHPQAMLAIVEVLCDKLRTATAMIEDNTHDMLGRVARGLLRLAQQHGRRRKDRTRINLKLSQSEFGTYVGLSRANVSRQLSELKSRGAIEIDSAYIVILDEKLLVEAADAGRG
jgi:CRP/FNR family transcriptional regulator, cyclic AMP receptor protein